MKPEQKQEIALLLRTYVDGHNSQKQAAATIDGVSEATIVQVLKGNWDHIAPEMWRTIGKQIGWNRRISSLVETMNFNTCILYFDIAKQHGETFAIVGGAGSGKTFAGEWYRDNMKSKNVYYIQCAEYWNKKNFLQEMCEAMGRNSSGMNVYELMKYIVAELRKQDHPLFIMDEVDKLKHEVKLFFITLYNQLHGLCGIVWTSTDAIMQQIDKGRNKNKIGYNEIFSRIGRRFVKLPGLSRAEAIQLCENHGITETEDAMQAWNECDGDIRRIDRNYIKNVMKKQKRA